MARISREALCRAIAKIQAQDLKQKEALADELFRDQPHMFGSFLVQHRLGVSPEKMEFLLDILFVCFQAMKESGLAWPLITEDEQGRQMARYMGIVKFGEDLSAPLRDLAMQKYIGDHPEKELLAHVTVATANWLKRIVPEETDRYVMMTAANLVNCIAFVPLPISTPSASRKQGVARRTRQ
jgi:hypothetical protein